MNHIIGRERFFPTASDFHTTVKENCLMQFRLILLCGLLGICCAASAQDKPKPPPQAKPAASAPT